MQTHVTLFLNQIRPNHQRFDCDEWRQFVTKIIAQYKALAIRILIKRENDLTEYIRSTFPGRTDSEKFYIFSAGLKSIPHCKMCSKEVIFLAITKGWRPYCSHICMWKDSEYREHIRETNLARHGGVSPFSSSKCREKGYQTNIKLYGAANPFASPEIKKRIKQTNLERYGVPYSGQAEITRNKMKATCQKRYGVDYTTQVLEVQDKMRETWIGKYGVTNPMQAPEILEKALKTAKKIKTYTTKSGKTFSYQGYENVAIDWLLNNGYDESDIITDKRISPTITYEINGKRRLYFPDIYIKSKNLLIEVKSTWTLKTHELETQEKSKAAINQGYDFILFLCSKKSIISRHQGIFTWQ